MVQPPLPRWATSRFSQTVRSAKMRRSSGTKPMPARATRYDSQPVMSMPLKMTRPDCGEVSPMIERMVVDLPTPLRPRRQTHSPAATSIDTPNSTRDSPYAVWISRDALDQPDRLACLGGRHAGRRLVEQQNVGLERQRQAELQLLLRAVREKPGNLADAGAEAQRLQQRERLVAIQIVHRREEIPAAPAMRQERGLHVLVHRQLREDVGALE